MLASFLRYGWLTTSVGILLSPGLVTATQCSNSTSFDFIVVGGGTAGLTIASRLSRDLADRCVLVLEAGPDAQDDPRVHIPGRRGQTFNTPLDWNFTTVSLPNANNRKVPTWRGRALGGSSMHNFMVWDRASIPEYDAWETLGNPGWNWASLYAAMLRSENYTRSDEYEDEPQGIGGLIQSTTAPALRPQQLSFLSTMQALGLSENKNSVSGYPLGVGFQPHNHRRSNWTRSYSTEYIKAAPVRNLFVRPDVTVAKILFNQYRRATGVILIDGTILRAQCEVILSAGVYQSPQLLELSGIGDAVLTLCKIEKAMTI